MKTVYISITCLASIFYTGKGNNFPSVTIITKQAILQWWLDQLIWLCGHASTINKVLKDWNVINRSKKSDSNNGLLTIVYCWSDFSIIKKWTNNDGKNQKIPLISISKIS